MPAAASTATSPTNAATFTRSLLDVVMGRHVTGGQSPDLRSACLAQKRAGASPGDLAASRRGSHSGGGVACDPPSAADRPLPPDKPPFAAAPLTAEARPPARDPPRLSGGALPGRGAVPAAFRRPGCPAASSGAGCPPARAPCPGAPASARSRDCATAAAAAPLAAIAVAPSAVSALRSPQRPARAGEIGGSTPPTRLSVGAVAASPSTRVV